jgi:hypothetical protein
MLVGLGMWVWECGVMLVDFRYGMLCGEWGGCLRFDVLAVYPVCSAGPLPLACQTHPKLSFASSGGDLCLRLGMCCEGSHNYLPIVAH